MSMLIYQGVYDIHIVLNDKYDASYTQFTYIIYDNNDNCTMGSNFEYIYQFKDHSYMMLIQFQFEDPSVGGVPEWKKPPSSTATVHISVMPIYPTPNNNGRKDRVHFKHHDILPSGNLT